MIRYICIRDHRKVYTPVYWKLWDAQTRFVVNYGGTGSSKSFSAAQKEVRMASEHTVNILVIRKVAATLRDSVIPSFRRRIIELGVAEDFEYNKTDRTLTCKPSGSQILFRGLDDSEKMKSIEGIGRIMIEEASELELEDFLELNRRARGMDNIQITLNFNPIHETHWLKKFFFDRQVDNCTIIHSTYKDNRFLTDEDRRQIEWIKTFNNNQYRVYALGEWGLIENNSPWLFGFDRAQHVKPASEVKFLPTFPVYLSFDFNRQPAVCLAVQMSPGRGLANSFIHFIKEFSVEGQLSELCARIKAAFPASILFVTGDASGSHGDVGFESRHATYYQMIRSYLGISERQLNLNTKNLEFGDSRQLCNVMFNEYKGLVISDACPLFINDCTIATVDDESQRPHKLKKDREIYKMDLLDAMRYFFQTYFKDWVENLGLRGKL